METHKSFTSDSDETDEYKKIWLGFSTSDVKTDRILTEAHDRKNKGVGSESPSELVDHKSFYLTQEAADSKKEESNTPLPQSNVEEPTTKEAIASTSQSTVEELKREETISPTPQLSNISEKIDFYQKFSQKKPINVEEHKKEEVALPFNETRKEENISSAIEEPKKEETITPPPQLSNEPDIQEQLTKEAFMNELNKLLTNMEKKKFFFAQMQEVAKKVDPSFQFSMAEYNSVADKMVALTKEVDIRLRENFFPLLRKVFMQCDDYNEAMRYFYNQEAFINTAHHWPDLKICPKYNEEAANIKIKMGSFDQMNEKILEELSKDLGFLMMIAPLETCLQFLFMCIESTPIIPTITRLFERLPAVREYRIPKYPGSKETDSFYMVIFLRLFNEHFHKLKLDTTEGRQNFESLIMSFIRTRLKTNRFGSGKEDFTVTHQNIPNLDATDFTVNWLFEHFARNRETRILLSLLSKLMEHDNNKKYDILWKKPGEETTELCVDPNTLISYVIEVFLHSTELDSVGYSEIMSYMPKIFTGIAKKFKADGVKITVPNIMGKVTHLDWAYKYAIGVWLQAVLEDYKPEIPTALFYALPEDKKKAYARLAYEQRVSLTEDFFCSIFEMALALPAAALEFLDIGTYATPNTDDVTVVICLALVKSTSKQASTTKIMALKPVLDKLIDLYGVPLIAYGLVNFYGMDAGTAQGLRALLPILLYGEAVRVHLMLEKDDTWMKDNVRAILAAFSNLANPLVDGFNKTLREGNMRGKSPSLTAGPVVSISNQLGVIRYLINCIEELLKERNSLDASNQFMLLSKKVNECIDLWFNTQMAPSLEDFQRLDGEDATKTVYAYAVPLPNVQKVERSMKMQLYENMLHELRKAQVIVAPQRRGVGRGWENHQSGREDSPRNWSKVGDEDSDEMTGGNKKHHGKRNTANRGRYDNYNKRGNYHQRKHKHHDKSPEESTSSTR
uniref:Edg1 TPR repeats region domain-containing protein n=1 Tax=Acrobeloides nanus TaxID=290746 RepID=A0A914CMJ0_9BILA